MNKKDIVPGDLWVDKTHADMTFMVVEVKEDTVDYRNIRYPDLRLTLTVKNFLEYRVKMK